MSCPFSASCVGAESASHVARVTKLANLTVVGVWCSCMQGFSDPSKFDPDRFNTERKEDIKYQKNFLTFGHGPHYCVGKDYAVNQIICYLANLSTRYIALALQCVPAFMPNCNLCAVIGCGWNTTVDGIIRMCVTALRGFTQQCHC